MICCSLSRLVSLLLIEAILCRQEKEGKRAKQREAVEAIYTLSIHNYKFEYLQFLIFLRKEPHGLLTIASEPSTITRDGVVLL